METEFQTASFPSFRQFHGESASQHREGRAVEMAGIESATLCARHPSARCWTFVARRLVHDCAHARSVQHEISSVADLGVLGVCRSAG